MDKAQVCEKLGAAEREVVSVKDTKVGTVAQTADGNAYLITDGEVKFLVPPHPKYDPSKNPLKVYEPAGADQVAVPVPQPELSPEQRWRAQQLLEVADNLDVAIEPALDEPAPPVGTEPLVEGPREDASAAPVKKAAEKKAAAPKQTDG